MAKTKSRRNKRHNGRKRNTPKNRKRNTKTNTQTPALTIAERLRLLEAGLRIWPHIEPAALHVWQWLEGWLSSML